MQHLKKKKMLEEKTVLMIFEKIEVRNSQLGLKTELMFTRVTQLLLIYIRS